MLLQRLVRGPMTNEDEDSFEVIGCYNLLKVKCKVTRVMISIAKSDSRFLFNENRYV